jgi:hypothetical protein
MTFQQVHTVSSVLSELNLQIYCTLILVFKELGDD